MAYDQFFSDNFDKYIDGSLFNEDAYIKFPKGEIHPREDRLVRYCAGKRVLHVGCVDHFKVLADKISRGDWLHQRICDVAERCHGVDVNAAGISWLIERGYEDLIAGDLSSPEVSGQFAPDSIDIALFGEIIEHVDNPAAFLSEFRDAYAGKVRQLIFTVPNAFRHTNVKNLFRTCEVINTDHRFWFTPYTLTKVLHVAGFDVVEMHMCTIARTDIFKSTLLRLFPLMADDILCVARFR